MGKGTHNHLTRLRASLVLAVVTALGMGLAMPSFADSHADQDKEAAAKGDADKITSESKASDEKSGDEKSGDESKASDEKSSDAKDAGAKSGDQKASDSKAADEKSGDAKAGDEKAADEKAADEKAGDKAGTDKAADKPAEDTAGARKPAAQGGDGKVLSYGVAVSGSPSLAPTPTLTLDRCPGRDTAAAARASASPVLQTGAIALGADCARQGDGAMVRSRADVSNLKITTESGDLAAASISTACVSAGNGSRAAVTITGLSVDGKRVEVGEIAPNTDLSRLADGLSGTANEQVRKGTRLSANALRVQAGGATITVGHVECDTALGAAPAEQPEADEAEAEEAPAPAKKGGGKDLAETGPASGMLTLLAFGALASGLLLRVGGEGASVLLPARYRRRPRPSPGVYQRARTWDPNANVEAPPARLDGAALDALKALEDR